jgi:exonuclease VII small subunit
MPRTRTNTVIDPRLLDLRERAGKAKADAEKWYARLKRAFNALEKCRKRVASAERRIRKYLAESDAEAPHPA